MGGDGYLRVKRLGSLRVPRDQSWDQESLLCGDCEERRRRWEAVVDATVAGRGDGREPRPVLYVDSACSWPLALRSRSRASQRSRSIFGLASVPVIALGPSGTGKTHVAQGLGLAACQRGLSVRFVTAAALVHELMEARNERRLLRLQKQFANHKLLIIDELGFVPLSKTGAELLFELVSQRYERAAVLITSNLPFDEWTETFGTERLTRALLDRLTHHVHILEMNGQSFRLNHSRARNKGSTT